MYNNDNNNNNNDDTCTNNNNTIVLEYFQASQAVEKKALKDEALAFLLEEEDRGSEQL